jgi:hypothetical protein
MAAGLAANITLAQFNAQAGQILLNLQQALAQAQEMQVFLAAQGASGLESLFGMASGDAATVISAFNDANAFAGVFAGTETVSNGAYAAATGYNFNTFIKLLVGTGVH